MKKGNRKAYLVILTFSLIVCFFTTPSIISAQKNTHIVKEGDTLWGICEQYYGDPDLWPELWQMNPFITNPHILEPGDVIILFEKPPEKAKKSPETQEKAPVKQAEEPKVMGFDLIGLTNLKTIGFFSKGTIPSWGTIIASDNNKLILDENDTAYVLFEKDKLIVTGDEFSVGTFSPLVKHPVTKQDLGYTFSAKAKLIVEKRRGLGMKNDKYYTKENVYQVKITEVYSPIRIGDAVMPLQSVSPCVLPVNYSEELLANIVASKDQQILLHTNSVVYLDIGFNDGINRGNVFQVVKGQVLDDPKPDSDVRYDSKSKIILPDISMGMILIVESRPNTSTAIVLTATEPFSTGAYITNIPWKEVEGLLANRPSCPIE